MENRPLDEKIWNYGPLGKMADYLYLFIVIVCRCWSVDWVKQAHKCEDLNSHKETNFFQCGGGIQLWIWIKR